MTSRYPIFQAPMAGGATTPTLVSAVSNAGAIGSLAGGYLQPEALKKAIQATKNKTPHPFVVNLFVPEPHEVKETEMQGACDALTACTKELPWKVEPVYSPYAPSFEQQLNVLLEEKPPMVSFTFGFPQTEVVHALKDSGLLVLGTATTLEEALFLEQHGAEAIVLQGAEAGGHRGTFLGAAKKALVPLTLLLKQVRQHTQLPCIAAGGIMNGERIRELLCFGAVGAQLGTAFLCCDESGVTAAYKQILLQQVEDKTVLTRAFSGKYARGIQNQFIHAMQAHEESILDYPIQNKLTGSMRQWAQQEGAVEFMSLWAGVNAHACRAMPAARLVETLVSEGLLCMVDGIKEET